MKLKARHHSQRKNLKCLLCGREPEVEALYFPPPTSLGRGVIFRYRLCASCFKQAGHAERAERIIERRLIAAN